MRSKGDDAKGHAKQRDTERGEPWTIHREKTEAIRNKAAPMGDDSRQYRERGPSCSRGGKKEGKKRNGEEKGERRRTISITSESRSQRFGDKTILYICGENREQLLLYP